MSEAAVHVGSGKVRDIFELDSDRLLLVASDRISVFDVVLPTEIPDKGRVLTGLSGFWFARTRELIPNHLLGLRPDGRSTECRRLRMLPIECVVRGYLAGSGWKDYQRTGSTSGTPAPRRHARVAAAPRADLHARHEGSGGPRREHRSPSTPHVSSATSFSRRSSGLSIALYSYGAEHAAARGIILADTKFEFGQDDEGRLVLADEVLTPDSSRFWPADEYEPGRSQPSFDKQYVRDFAESLGWDKTPPGPELPADVVAGTRRRYIEAFERITDLSFDAYLDDPTVVLR